MYWEFLSRVSVLYKKTTSCCFFIPVAINLTFNVGTNVKLNCSNKTGKDMIYEIWEIQLQRENCKIAFNTDGRSENNCSNGKKLQNTSESQSYLHIPDFSAEDQGSYRCESVYSGGADSFFYTVSVTGQFLALSFGWTPGVFGDTRYLSTCIFPDPGSTNDSTNGRVNVPERKACAEWREPLQKPLFCLAEHWLEHLSSPLSRCRRLCLALHTYWCGSRPACGGILHFCTNQTNNVKVSFIKAFPTLQAALVAHRAPCPPFRRRCCQADNSTLKTSPVGYCLLCSCVVVCLLWPIAQLCSRPFCFSDRGCGGSGALCQLCSTCQLYL